MEVLRSRSMRSRSMLEKQVYGWIFNWAVKTCVCICVVTMWKQKRVERFWGFVWLQNVKLQTCSSSISCFFVLITGLRLHCRYWVAVYQRWKWRDPYEFYTQSCMIWFDFQKWMHVMIKAEQKLKRIVFSKIVNLKGRV